MAGAVLLLTACTPEVTELVLVIDTDLVAGSEADTLRVTVGRPGEVAHSESEGFSNSGTLPRTLVLAHEGGALGVSVTVSAEKDGRTVVSQEITTEWVLGRTLTLPVFLSRACQNVDCDQGRSCRDGTCAPTEVSAGTLDPWNGRPERRDAGTPADSGVDGGRDGGADGIGLDASANDAGPVDAGPVDAGPVDAGPMDVGPIDTGPGDTGLPDIPAGCIPTSRDIDCDGVDSDCDGMVDEGAGVTPVTASRTIRGSTCDNLDLFDWCGTEMAKEQLYRVVLSESTDIRIIVTPDDYFDDFILARLTGAVCPAPTDPSRCYTRGVLDRLSLRGERTAGEHLYMVQSEDEEECLDYTIEFQIPAI